MEHRATWGRAALLLALFWSPLAGSVALFFALHAQEAHRAGQDDVATSDTRLAGMFCLIALLGGAFEWASTWAVQGALWAW